MPIKVQFNDYLNSQLLEKSRNEVIDEISAVAPSDFWQNEKGFDIEPLKGQIYQALYEQILLVDIYYHGQVLRDMISITSGEYIYITKDGTDENSSVFAKPLFRKTETLILRDLVSNDIDKGLIYFCISIKQLRKGFELVQLESTQDDGNICDYDDLQRIKIPTDSDFDQKFIANQILLPESGKRYLCIIDCVVDYHFANNDYVKNGEIVLIKNLEVMVHLTKDNTYTEFIQLKLDKFNEKLLMSGLGLDMQPPYYFVVEIHPELLEAAFNPIT